MLAPFRKRKRFKKNLLPVNNSIKTMIITQSNIYIKLIPFRGCVRGLNYLKILLK